MTIAEDVMALLEPKRCESAPDDATVISAVDQITALAKAYTRGRGFSDTGPNADITAVIVMAAARVVANPRQFGVELPSARDLLVYRGGFTGWSLAEQAALNRWRVRAQ